MAYFGQTPNFSPGGNIFGFGGASPLQRFLGKGFVLGSPKNIAALVQRMRSHGHFEQETVGFRIDTLFHQTQGDYYDYYIQIVWFLISVQNFPMVIGSV